MIQLDLFAPARPYRIEPFKKWHPTTDRCTVVDTSDGRGFRAWCGNRIGPGKCIRAIDGLPVADCPRHAAGYARCAATDTVRAESTE